MPLVQRVGNASCLVLQSHCFEPFGGTDCWQQHHLLPHSTLKALIPVHVLPFCHLDLIHYSAVLNMSVIRSKPQWYHLANHKALQYNTMAEVV